MRRSSLLRVVATAGVSMAVCLAVGVSNAFAADTVNPVTAITLTPGAPTGSNAWYKTDVNVAVTATDNVGVAETRCVLDPSSAPANFDAIPSGCLFSGAGAPVTGDGTHLLYAASRDTSNRKETVKSKSFKIDKTAPTAFSGSAARAPNAFGWYTSSISWAFTGTDATSGIASCPGVAYGGPDSTAATVNGTCKDKAGNQSAPVSSAVFKYDATGPVGVALSVTAGTLGNNGWYTSNVTVQASGDDPVSGIASCTSTSVTADTTGRNVTGSCKNGAGLSTSAAVLAIKLDKTPPVLSLSVSPDSLWPPDHQLSDVNAAVDVTDRTSGPEGFVVTSATSSESDEGVGDGDAAGDIQGFDLGTPDTAGQLRAERAGKGSGRLYTLTYTATDLAGNSASKSAIVDVTHDPAGPRKAAIGRGADRVLELQRADPGWEGTWYWYVGNTANATNLTGATALGLLEAFADTHDPAYLDGVKAGAAFAMAHLGVGATGVQHWIRMTTPDIVMLHHLTGVTGDPAYAARATIEWNHWKTFYPTAAALDAVFRSTNRRLGAWDLADFLEAATLSGDSVWADEAAALLANTGDPFYYGQDNPYYPLTVSGALRALAGNGYADGYQAEVTALLSMVVDTISDDSIDGGIQTTAYGIMALRTVGGPAHSYANAMAKWLATRQAGYGGWLDGDFEYAESDGEAVRAMAATLGRDLTLPGFAPGPASGGGWRAEAGRGRAYAFGGQ